jgi:hypothetical protein
MPALDDILALPGNRPVYQRLRELLDARQAIAFAGAGVSAPLYPLWPKLLKSLAQAPVERGLATAADEAYWLRTAEKRPLEVASQIHRALTDAHYYPLLYETFKDRPPFFTPAHDALIRCNFKAWITTNYDQGLVEARRIRRQEIRETGFAIWNQPAEIERWLTGDRFGPDSGPILFAHGHFADAPNIVLDHESYRRAYATPAYRRFFEDLWIREHLVFAGFSFNDVTLTAIADEIVGQIAHAGPPRHIAILALSEDYNDGMRREYLETFHADVLFYPAPAGDHSALVVLLESLARPAAVPVAAPVPPAPPLRGEPLRVFLCHSSTDRSTVRQLCVDLKRDGYDPWLDDEILAREDWEEGFRNAIDSADAILVCLSPSSVNKDGYLQREIRLVLDESDEKPEGMIIPVRLQECEVPYRLRHLQWIDLFEEHGYSRLRRALQAKSAAPGTYRRMER